MDQNTITFITAATALIAAVAGSVLSYRVARHQIRANVVSSNPERWAERIKRVA